MCVCTLLCTWKMKWMHNAQNKMKTTKSEWEKKRQKEEYRTSNSYDKTYGPRVLYCKAMALKRESGTAVYHFKWWKKEDIEGKIPSMGSLTQNPCKELPSALDGKCHENYVDS